MCDATIKDAEFEWECTLNDDHEGPHEAWGFDRLFCRWGPSQRSPVQQKWRDYMISDLADQTNSPHD